METVIAAIILMGLLMLGMAVGVMFKRAPLKGSCGGEGGDCLCDRLGIPRECELEGGDQHHDHDHAQLHSNAHSNAASH
ncbi:MAG: hypothetical protein CSA62_11360 [Planctomycetota bacterium]|nr:MAG: hypothetical protein CSA62_11360 [Planctomycetota bacterium]